MKHTDWNPPQVGALYIGIDPGEVTGIAAVSYWGELAGVLAYRPKTHSPVQMYNALLGWLHGTRLSQLSLTWERPTIRGQEMNKAGSLITTGYRAGLAVGMVQYFFERHGLVVTCQDVVPYDWKGQTPKYQHNRWVRKSLSDEERRRIDEAGFTKAESDDILDAIGIAKWAANKHRRLRQGGP